MYLSNHALETFAQHEGPVAIVAKLALGQRQTIVDYQTRLARAIEKMEANTFERQLRELDTENRRLKRIIAELQSRG